MSITLSAFRFFRGADFFGMGRAYKAGLRSGFSAGLIKSAGRARAPQAAFGGLRQQRGEAALPFRFAERNERARARPLVDFAEPCRIAAAGFAGRIGAPSHRHVKRWAALKALYKQFP